MLKNKNVKENFIFLNYGNVLCGPPKIYLFLFKYLLTICYDFFKLLVWVMTI